jgi:hypothetical protein
MLTYIALLPILYSAVHAQNATTSTSSSSMIPSGISQSCQSFLTSLDTNSDLASCLSAVSTATSAFSPGSTVAPSSAAVTSALDQLCSDSVDGACSQTVIRPLITDFYNACSAELTTKEVDAVLRIYDVLYTFLPMQQSICSKDDSGNWCVMAPTTTTREVSDTVTGSPSFSLAQLLSFLYVDNSALKRRDDSTFLPNITTFQKTNLPYLFLDPDLDATSLCTTCSRNVLTAYINFESNVPYAPGLNNSVLLNNQTALYNAIQKKCPSGFLSGAVQAAGGISSSPIFSSAVSTIVWPYQSILTLAMGVVTLGVVYAF